MPTLLLAFAALICFPIYRIVVEMSEPDPALPAVALAAPPCRATTPEALVAEAAPPLRSFRFDGAIYSLRRGHAECTLTRYGHMLARKELAYCQFSQPVSLQVEADGRVYAFGAGSKAATVWLAQDTVRCALDSDLNNRRRMAQRAASKAQATSGRAP